jgi:hypothetical protein
VIVYYLTEVHLGLGLAKITIQRAMTISLWDCITTRRAMRVMWSPSYVDDKPHAHLSYPVLPKIYMV